jgi:N-acetylmuramoyl-L-alanine amidase
MTKTLLERAHDPHRAFPLVTVRHRSACQSPRAPGSRLQLITIHDTEGANIRGVADLRGLGDLFAPIAFQASAHVGTDADGMSGRFVEDALKAWHCAYYNSVSLGIEQIGFATLRHWPARQYDETARWCAYWSRVHGIPLQRGAVSPDGHVLRHGLVRHSDLGSLGGGHHDPGAGYDLGHLIDRARHYRQLQNAAAHHRKG